MRRYDVIAEICDHMLALDWKPYQNDHEDANGQFEMNWEYDDALATADKHSFFKFMVRSVAEKHGLRATFMPKPFQGLTGNGCHVHISVWDKAGKTNVFADQKMELGLSAKGRNFLGGIMKHASALAAICNPTVNSYKRINAPRTSSGATWAPNTVTWTGNNRTHMVRVPGPGRFELRLPDGAQVLSLVPSHHDHRIGERIGVRLETEHVVANAIAKRAKKGCDWIVANDVSGDVMGGAENAVHMVTEAGVEDWPRLPKPEVARRLAARIAAALETA